MNAPQPAPAVPRPRAKSGLGAPPILDPAAWLELVAEGRPADARALLAGVATRLNGAARSADAGQRAMAERGLSIGQILHDLEMDAQTVAAGTLLGASEAQVTPAPVPGVPAGAAAALGELVQTVQRLQAITDLHSSPGDELQTERLRRLLLTMVSDVRAALALLAERLHDLRGAAVAGDSVARAMASQTLALFAPLASRLGIWQVKWELEDLALRALQPQAYRDIARQLSERRIDRERYINGVVERLQRELHRAGIHAEVTGRPKHIYSIWRKMQAKSLGFHELFDVRAVRVITASVAECYAVLGIVHSLWQYVPREFDDYIANPKTNRYQSLHTAVVGPEGRTVEVQIRTQGMHEHAERGVAAHWRYKEGGGRASGLDGRLAWLRQALEWHAEMDDPDGAFERLRADIDDEHVYVLTPKGRVIELPVGATPIDFAYRVHTDIGHRCRGARVDGVMVPLTRELQSGETVEILAVRTGSPSRDWLNRDLGYLRTARARAKVRHWFRRQDHAQNLADGREAWERELRRLRIAGAALDGVPERFNLTGVDDLFAAIGSGDLQLGQVVRAAQAQLVGDDLRERRPLTRRAPSQAPSADVRVEGVGDLMTQMARCCSPLPPEPILGYITRGRGVSVHRRGCPNAQRLAASEPNRILDVHWGGEEKPRYTVTVLVKAHDRRGLLRDVSGMLAGQDIDVRGLHSETDERDQVVTMRVSMDVSGVAELSRVLGRLLQVRNVFEASRLV